LSKQAAVYERGDRGNRIEERIGRRFGNRLRRLQREPAGEDGEPSKEGLLRRRQEVVAPGDPIAHGLLPGGCITRTARKQRQAVLQPLAQRR